MFDNRLKLNSEKTEFIVFVSKQNQEHVKVKELHVGADIIPSVPVVRNLGVYMDSHLSFEKHISHIRKICFMYIGWIKKIRHLLTFHAAKTLVHALIISRLDYCNSLLTGLPKCELNRLQIVMNAAARVITRVSRKEPITPSLIQLHWLPVAERCQFKTLTLVFKSVNGMAPPYLEDLVTTYNPPRVLRSSSGNYLEVIKPKRRYGQRSFEHMGAVLWNDLPDSIRNARTIQTFKAKLKTFMFIKAYGENFK